MARYHRLSFALVSLLASSGCARSKAPESSAPNEAELTRLRQENARLRQRMQFLDDRLMQLEQRGHATGSRGELPVVRLRPPQEPAPEPEAVREHPIRPSRGVSLSPLPNSAMGGGLEAYEQLDGSAGTASSQAAASTPAEAGAPEPSYRLVGSQLVELTKTRGPKRPDRAFGGPGPRSVASEYESALAMYKAGDYARAAAAFETFVATHPSHDYADNAMYWRGEAAYDQGHYADALAAFTEVVERYGGGNKAPDALLKIGLCYGRIGDVANARDVLTQLMAAYPDAHATTIARTKLSELESP